MQNFLPHLLLIAISFFISKFKSIFYKLFGGINLPCSREDINASRIMAAHIIKGKGLNSGQAELARDRG